VSEANVEGEYFPPQRKLRKKKGLLFEEWSDLLCVFQEFGGSRPKAVEGGYFPLQGFFQVFPETRR